MKIDSNHPLKAGNLLGSYHILFETMSEGVFFQLTSGSLVEANPAGLKLLGLSKEEFIGKNTFADPWDIINEDGKACPIDEYPSKIALKTGQPVMHKIVAVRNASTKQYVWVVVNAIPQFRKGESQPYCVMVTMHKMGWRKREEEIRLARIRILEIAQRHTLDELLTATLDELEKLTGSMIGFYHFLESDQTTLSLQNWSTATLQKFCLAEGKGRHYNVDEAGIWVDCVHERKPVIHNDYKSMPHRKGLPKDHTDITRELVVPVFRGDKIMAILGVGNKTTDYTEEDVEVVSRFADLVWDIVEIKRAEEALASSETKFRVLFKELNDGITLTHQGAISDTNLYMAELLGYENPDELIGRNLLDHMTVGSREKAKREIELIQRGQKSESSTEFTFIRKNGTEITVEMRGARVDLGGKIYGLSVHHDITSRQQAEKALRQKIDELEKFNDLTIGREMNMIELKKEVNWLLQRLGEKEKYRIVE
jgi:PAS domain S-box-containing protein